MITYSILSSHTFLLSYNLKDILYVSLLCTLSLFRQHLLTPSLEMFFFLKKVEILSKASNDLFRGSVLDHHLLIVASALCWALCLYYLAHPNIELCFYFLISRHFAQFNVILDEMNIPNILLSVPMMLAASFGCISLGLDLNNPLGLGRLDLDLSDVWLFERAVWVTDFMVGIFRNDLKANVHRFLLKVNLLL